MLVYSGYMAPEYAMRGQFSVKSDVFSFGVLILEIVSGKKNTDLYQTQHADDLLNFVSRNQVWHILSLYWCQSLLQMTRKMDTNQLVRNNNNPKVKN